MENISIEMLDKSVLSKIRLTALLKELDQSFVPPVSSIQDINHYCQKLITNGEIFLLKDGGVELGFVAIYVNDHKGKCAFISSIGIKPKYQRSGMGKVLVEHVTAVARDRGMHKIRLEVNRCNEAAQQLYRKCGFKKISGPHDSKTSNAMFMEKRLAP